MDEKSTALHEARFLSLVLSLHGSAWMAMGKVASPVTGRVERDLEAARGSIDLLETLRIKTRGNLTKEEEKILGNALSVLQLNFVDERARGEGETPTIPNPESKTPNSGPERKKEARTPNPESREEGAAKADPGAPGAPSPGGA
jgi:hypothetical protein